MGLSTAEITGVLTGAAAGEREYLTRKSLQEQLTSQVEAREQKATRHEQSNERYEQEIAQLKMTTDKLRKDTLKSSGREVMLNLYGGNLASVNQSLQNADTRKMFNNYTNIEKRDNRLYGTTVNPDGTTSQAIIPYPQLRSWSIHTGAQAQIDEHNKKKADISRVQEQSKTEISRQKLNEAKALEQKLNPAKRDALRQATVAFQRGNPNATEEETINFFSDYAQKLTAGASYVKEEKELSNLAEDQKESAKTFAQTKLSKARELENRIIARLPKIKQDKLAKDLKSMSANHKMVKGITRIVKEAKIGTPIDKDIVADIATYTNKIFGNDIPQTVANVDFNTAGGLLLANFMKEISGATVSDRERAVLENVLMGGNLADETFVLQAMTKFASELKENNKLLYEDNKVNAPLSAGVYTNYGDKTRTQPAVDLSKYDK